MRTRCVLCNSESGLCKSGYCRECHYFGMMGERSTLTLECDTEIEKCDKVHLARKMEKV